MPCGGWVSARFPTPASSRVLIFPDFFATPLNGLFQYGTIPSDVDLRIGVVVMRRMSFALGGGKRFPPLLYIRHAKEQASAEHFC